MPHHENLEKKNAPKPETKECHCDDKCECGCNCGCNCGCGCCCGKKFVAKLIVAVIIFLAGFGCAHMCRCFHHCGKMMPAQHEMLKHKGHHGYNGGAGTMIIINADGKTEMMPWAGKHHKMKHFPHHKNMPKKNDKPAENKSAE